eukprot:TRINITY_DN51724_c1_g2_i1.p2 TRINITY_DN51724_c1_g2~~TRINITY_DN51724_c1_g2_i1.p2  ORF type:complete len:168 (-),score=34.95 TRINITY_DN51724_c1_g2_i1:80-583(-)
MRAERTTSPSASPFTPQAWQLRPLGPQSSIVVYIVPPTMPVTTGVTRSAPLLALPPGRQATQRALRLTPTIRAKQTAHLAKTFENYEYEAFFKSALKHDGYMGIRVDTNSDLAVIGITGITVRVTALHVQILGKGNSRINQITSDVTERFNFSSNCLKIYMEHVSGT